MVDTDSKESSASTLKTAHDKRLRNRVRGFELVASIDSEVAPDQIRADSRAAPFNPILKYQISPLAWIVTTSPGE